MTETWRVLLPQRINPAGPESIDDFASCTRIDEYGSIEDALNDIDRYDAVVVRIAQLDEAILSQAEHLKVVAKHGAGLDNVDVDAASERDVVVCNTPGENARSVAEHAIALLFGVRRNLRMADAHVRNGGWDRAAYAGHELTGDVLGLFGCGAIACETADLALGMGQTVLAFDPYIPDEAIPDGVERVADPLALFERADAVSIHVPLTEETQHAVSTTKLRSLGSDGVLLNTSRGPIVDEAALVEELDAGVIAGAGLDVFEEEPPGADHPLSARSDILLTPHIGGVTDAAMERMSLSAAENVRTVYEGDLPESTVNRKALERREAR